MEFNTSQTTPIPLNTPETEQALGLQRHRGAKLKLIFQLK
jgi:hypothetical protein